MKEATSGGELRDLRGAIFQCMTMHFGEAEAMDRIRTLDRCA